MYILYMTKNSHNHYNIINIYRKKNVQGLQWKYYIIFYEFIFNNYIKNFIVSFIENFYNTIFSEKPYNYIQLTYIS